MTFIVLRGHHIRDFWFYLERRDKGNSHQSILLDYSKSDRLLGFDGKSGESFEKYTSEVFKRLYEKQMDKVILTLHPDDICCGPRRCSPEKGCGNYEYVNCQGNILRLEDKFFIEKLKFEEILNVKDLIDKVRSSSWIGFSFNTQLNKYFS